MYETLASHLKVQARAPLSTQEGTLPTRQADSIYMADVQSTDEVLRTLNRLVGESVAQLQVLGVNSLKSVEPSPSDLIGSKITAVAATDRILTMNVGIYTASVALERTGRLQWLERAEPAQIGDPSLPTIRLILQSGTGLDFSEPAKTKRISVKIVAT